MEKEPLIHLVPDTNCFIHYRFFEINWKDVAEAKSVVINIAPVVLEEIANLKDMGDNKLRWLALTEPPIKES